MDVEILTQEDINKAFKGTNFSCNETNEQVLRRGLLKRACGYYTGFTLKTIMYDLKLTTDKGNLTKKGKQYLYVLYED